MSTDCPLPRVIAAPPVPQSDLRLSIVLLVRALGFGGSERQVVYLARGLAQRGHNVTVATFYPGGPFECKLSQPNLQRLVIGKSGRGDVLGFFWRAHRALTAPRPDVVYSFLPVPNLLATALQGLSKRRSAVVWGIRGTPLDLARYDWLERASIRLERLASRLPDLVLANSRAGAEWARGPHFHARRLEIVANGIDTNHFRPPISDQRIAARNALRCPEDALVVTVVGRLDPMKDHPTFLEGFAAALRAAPHLFALIVGDGPGSAVEFLQARAAALGIQDRVAWVGGRREIESVYHAADLLCLPSAFGEGFPNVVGEAMASGLSCVVTPVGDSAHLVGDTGIVVPVRSPKALARAILDCADRIGESRPQNLAARRRILEHFSVDAMVSATEDLLLHVVRQRKR